MGEFNLGRWPNLRCNSLRRTFYSVTERSVAVGVKEAAYDASTARARRGCICSLLRVLWNFVCIHARRETWPPEKFYDAHFGAWPSLRGAGPPKAASLVVQPRSQRQP